MRPAVLAEQRGRTLSSVVLAYQYLYAPTSAGTIVRRARRRKIPARVEAPAEPAMSLLGDANTLKVGTITLASVTEAKRQAVQKKNLETIERVLMEWF